MTPRSEFERAVRRLGWTVEMAVIRRLSAALTASGEASAKGNSL